MDHRSRNSGAVRPRDWAATVQIQFLEQATVALASVRFEAHCAGGGATVSPFTVIDTETDEDITQILLA